MRRLLPALAVAGALAAAAAVPSSGPACHVQGSGTRLAPDDACTPGDAPAHFTRTQACTRSLHPRERVSAALRARVLARYGIDPQTFAGELDHRIPVWRGGHSTITNLWPQAGPLPNPKDRLELDAYTAVCAGRLDPDAARALFAGDWRQAIVRG